MTLDFKIIGYYGHFNSGDEQYKTSIKIFLKKYLNVYDSTFEFYDCDKIKYYLFNDSDIIILGGGDVINYYFLNTIYDKFKDKQNIIIALSVGIPYLNIILESEKINRINYFFLRSKIDIDMLRNTIGTRRVFYLPDLSILLFDKLSALTKVKKNTTKNVLFCLSRHIYNKDSLNQYYNVIYNLAKFIEYLINDGYHIIFLPFNTKMVNDKMSENENDVLIGNDIIGLIDKSLVNKVTNIKKTLDHNEISEFYNISDFCVPMRFHAALFSIYHKVPFLPIFTTRKMQNLVDEIKWDFFYKLPLNNKCIPINLDHHQLLQKFKLLQSQNTKILINKIVNRMDNFKNTVFLNDLFKEKLEKFENKNTTNDEIINDTFKKITIFAKNNGYDDFRKIKDIKLQKI